MSEILLTTLNARYIHAAFGLRYLMANLGEMQERAAIQEFDINQRALEIVESILKHEARIVGFGVYIWNVTLTAEVIALLKRLRPNLIIILGGPEVSHEVAGQAIVELADHVITGEADLKFAEVCRALLAGEKVAKIVVAELPTMESLVLPYELYTAHDLEHRVLYVEASRGCPFTCEFCLSSLDVPVRAVALEPILASLKGLLDRGARQFKFVDRTFNLNLNTSRAILEFFLENWRDGLFVHFEMVPDRLPEQLREVIARFPAGAVQLEVGIQTFDEATSKNISRRQNVPKLEDNIRYLRENTGVHIHADLIVGLPGEDMASFGRGFDRLVALRPQEIQVGILKRLRGTPIVRHDVQWEMIYSPQPPYDILQNKLLDFSTMQRLRRFARLWDMVGNSGHFLQTTPMIWAALEEGAPAESPFVCFLQLSDWMSARLGKLHSVARVALAENLFVFLTQERGLARERIVEAIERDWLGGGVKRERLSFLEPEKAAKLSKKVPLERAEAGAAAPKRQARHLVND